MRWGKGFEGQRIADLGDGTFLNPVFAGDRPDPTILKDGDDYWMTFSSFDAYPGIVVWHSRDLVNWNPVGPALTKPVGSVWACDIAKHGGRYYIYFPARTATKRSNYVVHAKSMRGPWSEPIDLNLPAHIDPGHIVGEDGKRYLFLSGGDRVKLKDDGLSTDGAVEHVYDPWRYPDEWVVESFSPEGPKVMRHGKYFYMVTAVGGTAGPPTGPHGDRRAVEVDPRPVGELPSQPAGAHHGRARKMVVTRPRARWSKDPRATGGASITATKTRTGRSAARRCSTALPGPRTAGSSSRAGIFRPPSRSPRSSANQTHGIALSDDFSKDKFGIQWAFYSPGENERARVAYEDGALVLTGKGDSPSNCSPITCITGDQAYRCEVEIEVEGAATGGVLFFYNKRMYVRAGLQRSPARASSHGDRRHVARSRTASNGECSSASRTIGTS